jgi:hypothetical protein
MRIRESKAKRISLPIVGGGKSTGTYSGLSGEDQWTSRARFLPGSRSLKGLSPCAERMSVPRAKRNSRRRGRNFQPHVTLARLRSARAGAAYLERQGRIEAEPFTTGTFFPQSSGIANNILSFGLGEGDQQSTHIHTFVL